jgi:hypothetical protein
MTGASAGVAAVENLDRGAASEPPGDAEPNHASANNGDAWLAGDMMKLVRQSGSLRWNDPDRFDGFDLSRPSIPCRRKKSRDGTPGR